jgi:hypothetical protein
MSYLDGELKLDKVCAKIEFFEVDSWSLGTYSLHDYAV